MHCAKPSLSIGQTVVCGIARVQFALEAGVRARILPGASQPHGADRKSPCSDPFWLVIQVLSRRITGARPLAREGVAMKAVRFHQHGSADKLVLEDVPDPVPLRFRQWRQPAHFSRIKKASHELHEFARIPSAWVEPARQDLPLLAQPGRPPTPARTGTTRSAGPG